MMLLQSLTTFPRRIGALAPVLAFILGACAARTSLEPAGEGNLRGSASLGGPLVNASGTYIPVPYISAGAAYGVADQVDLTGALHLFSLLYGVVGVEAGGAWYPVSNDGGIPTVGINPRLLMFASVKEGVDDRVRIYPVVSSSAAWRVGSGLLYTGFDLAVPLTRSDYDEEAAPVIFSPLLGYRWSLGESVGLFTELKWHGANIRSDQLAAEYLHPFGNGAVAPFIAVDWSF